MTYDVMILGAGMAGTTAAILLHRAGSKVVLIERAVSLTRGDHSPEWLCASARGLLDEFKIDCSECVGAPLTGIVFHSADLKQTAFSASKEPAFRIDYPQLIKHMQVVALNAGVRIADDAEPARVDLGERSVVAEFADAQPLDASFLLLADGACRTFAPIGSGQVPICGVNLSPSTSGRWSATLELQAGKSRDAKAAADANMHWLLVQDRSQPCLLWWWDGSTCVLRLMANGTGYDVRQQLCDMTEELLEAGLIVSRESVQQELVVLRPAPARSALEVDSHVDKRTLLIGDAGGFVSETNGEGIYPAIWSARLAVQCIMAAAGSTHPQDELRQFSTAWRSTMADYLRAPNTDVHFLLPLIFSNQQMADRMAAAFWTGQNI